MQTFTWITRATSVLTECVLCFLQPWLTHKWLDGVRETGWAACPGPPWPSTSYRIKWETHAGRPHHPPTSLPHEDRSQPARIFNVRQFWFCAKEEEGHATLPPPLTHPYPMRIKASQQGSLTVRQSWLCAERTSCQHFPVNPLQEAASLFLSGVGVACPNGDTSSLSFAGSSVSLVCVNG